MDAMSFRTVAVEGAHRLLCFVLFLFFLHFVLVVFVFAFLSQGDAELEAGLKVSPMMDRKTAAVDAQQYGFIDFIVGPLVRACACEAAGGWWCASDGAAMHFFPAWILIFFFS